MVLHAATGDAVAGMSDTVKSGDMPLTQPDGIKGVDDKMFSKVSIEHPLVDVRMLLATTSARQPCVHYRLPHILYVHPHGPVHRPDLALELMVILATAVVTVNHAA